MRYIVQYKYTFPFVRILFARYTVGTMAKKKMTIEDIAIITANGFKGVDKRFEGVDKRFEEIEEKMQKGFDRIENLLLLDQMQRIERLEDAVLQLKVKVGMR